MSDRRPARLSRALAPTILASFALGILVSAPAASAISSGDQYIPKVDKGGVSGRDSTGLALGVGSGAPPSAGGQEAAIQQDQQVGSGDGDTSGLSIPGSDFPLTLFVAIIGGLLAAGLLIRLVAPALDRRA